MQNLYPLYPRAIGYFHNQAIAAWYDYHRLEVKNDEGNILFVFERESEFGFIKQVAIVLNRYLIIAIGDLCVFGLKVYDLENFQWLWDDIKINGGEIGLLAIHPTKPIIAIEDGKPGFSLWNIVQGQEISHIDIPGVYSVAFNPINSIIAVSVTDNIFLIDISDKRNFIVYSVNPLNAIIKALKPSQDIILINPSDEWHPYFPWNAIVSWSIDCKSLIFGNYAIDHWELEKNQSLQIFDGLRDEPEQIIVSRDGNLAVAPSYEGNALLMNLQTGEEILLEDIYSACCSQESDRSFMVAGINSIRHLSLFI